MTTCVHVHVPTATVGGALRWMLRYPWQAIGRRWNYKSAVMSSLTRAGLFFAANASAGPDAALAAVATESCLRFVTSGFHGAMTQAFAHIEPARAGTIAALVVLPWPPTYSRWWRTGGAAR